MTRTVLLAVLISLCALAFTAPDAGAAVGYQANSWRTLWDSNPAAISSTLTTTTTVTVSAGTNRLLVAGVCMEHAAAATITTINVRLDNSTGPLFTTGSMPSTAQRQNCWIGYLTDASGLTTGNHPLYVNVTTSASTMSALTVQAGVYTGVDQTLPETVCFAWNSAVTTVAFGNQVDYVANSMTVYVASNGGSGATISDNATPVFSTATSTATANESMFARHTAVAAASGFYSANTTTVTFAGTTSARSSVAIVSLLPAATDVTPPVAGTMTVSPDGNGFTSASPLITGTFTDNESGLISCEYTTNGTTWSATGVTITNNITPGVHQCTVTPTGLTGALSINMRATSSGGGPTSNTSLTRQVDATPPTNVSFTATPGDANITLNWSYSETGIGFVPTNTYTIRWAAGATAPANCTAGTLLGNFPVGTTSTPHTGLTNGSTYSYRICATDLAGNQDTGQTVSATPNLVAREVLSATNTAIAAAASDSATGVVMQRIQATSSASPQGAGDNQLVLTGLGLTELGTATAFNDAQVYSSATLSTGLPAGAVLIGNTGPWSGATTTISLSQGTVTDRTVVTGTPKYLYLVLAMQSGQSGNTVQTRITGFSVSAPDTGLLGQTFNSNTITLSAGPKATITACSDCHGFPPSDGTARNVPGGRFPGAHDRHANSYAMACTTCHVDNTVIGFGHQSGVINMANPIGGDAGASYTKGQNFAVSNTVTDGYCLNVYCHSNGAGGTNQTGDTRTRGWVTSPSWVAGAITTCTVCHGMPPAYTSGTTSWGAAKMNSHGAHPTDCSKCHSATTLTNSTISTPSNHANGTYNVIQEAGTTTFTYTYNVAGGTCTNISCHGGSTAQWGVTQVDCVACHSGTLTKTLGGGGTIRNVTGAGGDFTLASRHLRSATTIIKWDCVVCHMEGQYTGANAGSADSTYHQDGAGATGGRINLRNVDSPATGWAIDNVGWPTTAYRDLDTFCLTCHDADGANGISVNATNTGVDSTAPTARRLTPFNTTDVVGGMLGASTSSANAGPAGRSAVVDIKGKFNAGTGGAGTGYNGNVSQHAVIGQRYSTTWTSWLATTWSSYILKKTGINVNVSRETSLLSCADCHALDTGSGAHGGTASYNMWTTVIAPFCWRCHASGVYTLSGTSAAGSRVTHGSLDSRTNTSSAYGLPTASTWNCMLCHAGWDAATTVSRYNSYGNIHGTPATSTWTTPGGTRTMYRFLPGTYMAPSPPTDAGGWTSTTAFTCYFTATANAFNNCNSHSGSTAGRAYNYGRSPRY